jgi:hypothetical protein
MGVSLARWRYVVLCEPQLASKMFIINKKRE